MTSYFFEYEREIFDARAGVDDVFGCDGGPHEFAGFVPLESRHDSSPEFEERERLGAHEAEDNIVLIGAAIHETACGMKRAGSGVSSLEAFRADNDTCEEESRDASVDTIRIDFLQEIRCHFGGRGGGHIDQIDLTESVVFGVVVDDDYRDFIENVRI